jgi:UPF0042 nucleotide-binding protein
MNLVPFENWPGAEPVGEFGLVVDPVDSVTVVQVALESFGFLHEAVASSGLVRERPQLVVDVRDLFRDPHHDPAARQLTGRDDAIRARVLDQPGAIEYVQAQAAAIASLVPAASAERPSARVIKIAVGCAGGRHRSVVIAESMSLLLNQHGIGNHVSHRDIRRPVVSR